MLDRNEARRQLYAQMQQCGMSLRGGSADIVADGRFHRCNVAKSDGRRGRDDGTYVLHLHSNFAVGGYENHCDGRGWQKWKFTRPGFRPTREQQQEIDREIEQARRAYAEHLAQQREAARKKAVSMWNDADKDTSDNPYLRCKGLTSTQLRQMTFRDGNTALLVPLYGEDRKIKNLQMINGDGKKLFLTGGRVGGCHYWLTPTNDQRTTICIAEGWATAKSIALATKHAVVIAFNAGNLVAVAKWIREQYPDHTIIVCADDDFQTDNNPGLSKATEAARAVDGKVALPKFGEDRGDDDKDFDDLRRAAGKDAVKECVEAAADPDDNPDPDDDHDREGDDEGDERKKQTDQLVELGSTCDLFRYDDTSYADIQIDGHRQTWGIKSKGFEGWLRQQFYRATKGAPNTTAFSAALSTLDAMARFEGPVREVSLRVAGHAGKIYLDLCDDDWRVIEIDADGWRVVDNAPVRFCRRTGMKPLPVPVEDGKVWTLKKYINVKDRADFILVVSWLFAALNPNGPYPVLDVTGEAGSAKSTMLALLRNLIDPNKTNLRGPPREDRDLHITARNSWVLCYDNLSWMPDWQSDAFAHLSTGGGFATRQLFSDADEILFDAQRPIMLGAIEQVVKRGDLADRIVAVFLDPITDKKRRMERELREAFEQDRPAILGALLKAVSRGLRRLPTINVEESPRLADFYRWAIACGDGVNGGEYLWKEGEFAKAYAANRAAVTANVVEADPIAAAISEFMDQDHAANPWRGTASELLKELADIVGNKVVDSKVWPSASTFGLRFDRYTTPLRRIGIDMVRQGPQGHTRNRIITITRGETPESPSAPSAPSAPRPTSPNRPLRIREFSDADGADRADGYSAHSNYADGQPAADTTRAVGRPSRYDYGARAARSSRRRRQLRE